MRMNSCILLAVTGSLTLASLASAQTIKPEPGDLVKMGTATTYERARDLCDTIGPKGAFRLYKNAEGMIAIFSRAAESRVYQSYGGDEYKVYALWVQPDDGQPRDLYRGNMFLSMYDGRGSYGRVGTPDQVLEFLGPNADHPADLKKWLESGIAVYCIKDGSSTVRPD
jgi:hypothetical protein